MLLGGLDLLYREALASAPEFTCRVEVWRGGVRIDPYGAEGLPIYGGGISATLTSQVTRQLALSAPEDLYPVDPMDLLQPYGNELRVFQGIKPGASVPYEWQTFRGRINEVTKDDDGAVQLGAVDRAADINDANFLGPTNSQTGSPINAEFRRLVLGGIPDATFGTFDIQPLLTPELTWEWSRSTACDDLATSASAFWYALANGDYVIRRVPWAIPQVSLLTLADGPGGVLTSATPSRSREDVFNSVTVIGERADGSTPVYATEADNDPASPTNANGAFGVKSKLVRAQGALTQSQAATTARSSLLQARSLTQTWTISMPADASLELGDSVTISARNLPPDQQVVASFALPLFGDSPMNVQLRAIVPGLVE